MTVQELLDRIVNAYAGATPEAMKTFVPVFYARLRKHEGPALDSAANEVFGAFKPKFDQKFPIPVDFEQHLPSGKFNLPSTEASIRGRMEGRRHRKASLMAVWHATQGPKIREARGPIIAQACTFLADRIASDKAWSDTPERVVLTRDQVDLCETRAVSQARVSAYGGRMLVIGTSEQWDDQMADVRERILAGEYPSRMGETAMEIRQAQRVTDRLAELARARRRGEPPSAPEMFGDLTDVPEADHG